MNEKYENSIKMLKYHKDPFQRKLMTKEEVDFLLQLQKEMNTQDSRILFVPDCMSVSKGRECPETSDHPAGRKHLIPSKIETGSGTDHSPEASGGCTYLKCNGIHGYRRDLSGQYLLFVYVPDGNGLPGGGSTGAASSKRNPFSGAGLFAERSLCR